MTIGVDDILEDLKSDQFTEKEASDTEPDGETSVNDLLDTEDIDNETQTKEAGTHLDKMAEEVAKDIQRSKQASADQRQDASKDIEKMAEDLRRAEDQKLMKEAEMYGSAIMHGLIQEANKYAEGGQTKTASTNQRQKQAQLQKAAEQGYQTAKQMLSGGQTKTASRQKQAQLQKAAEQGYQTAKQMLSGGQTKTAAEQEASRTFQKIAEISEDCFTRGYEAV